MNEHDNELSSPMGEYEKAQVQSQMAVARQYPRSLSEVKQQMMSYALLDEETAAQCFYTLPARKGGDGKPIQGPSVRLAEIALACYQHLRAGTRVIADDGKFITAQAVVADLQNNVAISIEVRRRVTDKHGRRYSEDMIAVTGNAACSIALRNATFRVVPGALVKPVYEAAKRLAVGDAKSLVQRRADALASFAKLGVGKDEVCRALGVAGAEDIDLEGIGVLIGYFNAIRDGDTTVDAVFRPASVEPASNPFIAPATAPQAPPATADPPNPMLDALGDLMAQDGVSAKDLLGILRDSEQIPATVKRLIDVPPSVLETVIADWQTLTETLRPD